MKYFFKAVFYLFFFTLVTSELVHSGELALSFDDVPRSLTPLLKKGERQRLLLQGLKDAGVEQVIFFSTTQGLNDKEKKARLENYIQAGHLLGNHTHSHRHPDEMGIKQYIRDIKKAHRKLKGYDQFVPFFRYPFLDYGKTLESRENIRVALNAMNYKNGYVTLDNADWYMDFLVQKAVKAGKTVHMGRLKQAYIEVLWHAIEFYDELAQELLRRSPKHVLLLHENDLAALFIKDLVVDLKAKNWTIISSAEAYTDKMGEMIPDTLLNNNGRIAAIADAKGVDAKTYNATQIVDEFFLKLKVFE